MRTAIVLSLCLAPVAGCAGQMEGTGAEPATLVTGDWNGFRTVGPAPCPAEAICLHGIVEARIGRVRTVSGPAVPRSLTARLQIHAQPARGRRIALLVRPPRPGAQAWSAEWLTGGRAGERGCVEAARLAEQGVAPPRGAELRDGFVCFPL